MTNNLTREYDNRSKDEVIAEQQDRIAALVRRTVELMGENQMLRDALALARQRFFAAGGDDVD